MIIESEIEKQASDILNMLVYYAYKGNRKAINLLKNIFEEKSWKDLKEKLETEGSVYYVWWMDGVRKLIRLKKYYAKKIDKIIR